MPAGRRVEVVRLFPDYAGTVLWFPHPVEYADSGLEEELVSDLRAWEQSYYAGLTDFVWRSSELEQDFARRGRALARRLAKALGEDFAVECAGETFRGTGPGYNPQAAQAFRAAAAAG